MRLVVYIHFRPQKYLTSSTYKDDVHNIVNTAPAGAVFDVSCHVYSLDISYEYKDLDTGAAIAAIEAMSRMIDSLRPKQKKEERNRYTDFSA